MSISEIYIEPSQPSVSLVTAPLSNEMQDRISGLQQTYSDHYSHRGLLLTDAEHLYMTFAEVIVPHNGEKPEDVNARVSDIRDRVSIAAKQVIQETGKPFDIPVAYDAIEATQGKVMLSALEAKQVNALRGIFTAVLWSSLDRPLTDIGVMPVRIQREEDFEAVSVFTTKNVSPFFRPINSNVEKLQLREYSPKTKKLEIIDEFS